MEQENNISELQYNKLISFLKKLFGEDFHLKAISRREGNITPIDITNEKWSWAFTEIYSNTLWYDPYEGVLYTYKPQEDAFFKKVITNAWGFRYIFAPIFIDGWGNYTRPYSFQVMEKGYSGLYKTILISSNGKRI